MFYYFTADAGCRVAIGNSEEPADSQEREERTLVSPNPAHSTIVVRGKSPIRQIEIFDKSGRKQLSIIGSNQWVKTIDISRLAPGIYLVQISTDGGRETRKLIVQ